MKARQKEPNSLLGIHIPTVLEHCQGVKQKLALFHNTFTYCLYTSTTRLIIRGTAWILPSASRASPPDCRTQPATWAAPPAPWTPLARQSWTCPPTFQQGALKGPEQRPRKAHRTSAIKNSPQVFLESVGQGFCGAAHEDKRGR